MIRWHKWYKNLFT